MPVEDLSPPFSSFPLSVVLSFSGSFSESVGRESSFFILGVKA